MSSASNEAEDFDGASLVPLSASVNMVSFKSGFSLSASARHSISSSWVLPIYKDDKKIRLSAVDIFSFKVE